MTDRLLTTYRIRASAATIAARAQAIAVEQSVEMPVEAISDPRVLRDIVGRVDDIADCGDGSFRVQIGLAVETIGGDAGQLFNMLFGNVSLQDDITLADVAITPALAQEFGGPNIGMDVLRARIDAGGRAFTCSAIKPQGLPINGLAALAARFAEGGLDFIKDDHGMANQAYGRFADRVPAIAAAIRATGSGTRYVPSLSGDLDAMRTQMRIASDCGLEAVIVAPMLAGFSTMQTLVRENPLMAFFAHPTLGGAARIAPDLLIGKLFRLLGADAVIFPNHGGRFGYSPATCRQLAGNATAPDPVLRPAIPVPAGGMTLARVGEMLDFYGREVMLLIGGNLLLAHDRLAAASAAFTHAVAQHSYR
jgi:ribulose-bisphosphate carboxylase large chain